MNHYTIHLKQNQLKILIKKNNTSLKYFASIVYTDAIRNEIL